jgi:dethiobiotin synthetase
VTIDLERIAAAFEHIARASDVVLVEGDACAMTPLSADRTQLDLIERLALPVLLIGPSRAGVIDAALPALQLLQNRRLKLAGVVFNRLDPQLSIEEASYPFVVEQFFGPVVRGVLPHFDAGQRADLDHLAARLQVHVDLDAILEVD